MTNQQLFNALSLIECELYYRSDGTNAPEGIDPEDCKRVHSLIDKALNEWHELTGCELKFESFAMGLHKMNTL